MSGKQCRSDQTQYSAASYLGINYLLRWRSFQILIRIQHMHTCIDDAEKFP